MVALLLWVALRPSAGPGSPAALEPEHPGGGAAAEAAAGGPSPGERLAELSEPPRPYERTRPVLPGYDGRGSLRGLVQASAGAVLPLPLRVHIGPSTSLSGSEHAERRTLEGGPEFEFADLPLGGYDVWIEAPGMNSPRTPVRLTEAAPSPFLVLRISPMGSLDGFVVRADGAAAEDLRVELRERDGDARLVTRTRPDGRYVFERVPDGEYRIRFGPEGQPLVPERELAFQAPTLQFPIVELPPTADVLLHTVDAAGAPVGGVRVTGFARPAGRLAAESDGAGNAWARNLLPGRYRLAATASDGRSGNLTIEVELEGGQEFWIAVR